MEIVRRQAVQTRNAMPLKEEGKCGPSAKLDSERHIAVCVPSKATKDTVRTMLIAAIGHKPVLDETEDVQITTRAEFSAIMRCTP